MDHSMDAARDRATTRRALLSACGGVGTMGVAGCLGSDDDTDASNDDATGNGANGNGEGAGGESIRLESDDGWAAPHDDVEIPSEPGEAILHIGGETLTLTGIANGGELTDDDASVTGAEAFELQGTFQGGLYHEDEISVEVSRMVGYEDTTGRWAESDSITLTRGDGTRLGNVIYRLYEDGRFADADSAGDLEGRRFTDEPFVHVTRDGVLTVVEEFESHVDDSMNGRLEFGARLPADWDEF